MSNLRERIETFNQELGAFGYEDTNCLVHDTADMIRQRLTKHSQYLAPNIRRRDLVLMLLVIGFDVPAIDLLADPIHRNLKER